MIDLVVPGFDKYPPFKTVGTCGIRPGGLPRWLELLTKLATILDLGTQSRLTRTPSPGQVEPPFQLPRRPICPKSTCWKQGLFHDAKDAKTEFKPSSIMRLHSQPGITSCLKHNIVMTETDSSHCGAHSWSVQSQS